MILALYPIGDMLVPPLGDEPGYRVAQANCPECKTTIAEEVRL